MGETVSVAKSVVVRDGKVLVLTKPDGRPDLPGGQVEEGENSEQAFTVKSRKRQGLRSGSCDQSLNGRTKRT